MAVLGAQLVFSLIMFSFLQKLSCFYSFGRWLLAGRLARYLFPTDEDLKKAAGIQTSSGGKGKGKKHDSKKGSNPKDKVETFTIPRNTPISLDLAKVETADLIYLQYYGEYLWLMDFALSASIVYVLTEIYYVLGDWNEMNISMLWCMLAFGFCLRLLLSHTALYFKGEDGGERILIITFGFFFLVMALGVLIIDENTLEFGLDSGYENFNKSAFIFLDKQGIESSGPVSILTFKIILAFFCSLLGALVAFPGLRMAKLHIDSLKYSKDSPLKQVLLHLNFVLPYVIVLLWVKPIGRDILCGLNWKVTTKLVSESVFDNIRVAMFVILAVVRLMLLPTHMQSHLNSAYMKIESIHKESGRISNIEIQKMVARVFYFLGVVVLQYLTPVVMMLFLAFMYKTLGNYSWSGVFGDTAEGFISSFKKAQQPIANHTASVNGTESIVDKAVEFSIAFSSLRSVFTPVFYRGILSFVLWWICTAWTIAMSFGLYYHSNPA